MDKKSSRKKYQKHLNYKHYQNHQNYWNYQNRRKLKTNKKHSDINTSLPPSRAPVIVPHYCPCPKYEGTAADILPQYLWHYIYIWAEPHREFWMYPVQIDKNNLRGYIWNNNIWIYSHIPVNQINGFY